MFHIIIACFSMFQEVSPFCWTDSPNSGSHPNSSRRSFILNVPGVVTSSAIVLNPERAWARNLPESTGADLSSTGTITKLIPIVKIRATLLQAQEVLKSQSTNEEKGSNELLVSSTLEGVKAILDGIPKDEKQFKQIFDEYSDPVSYKQRYMDSNAFLVYYTKGYDGPGRDSIEKHIPRQTLQYGARNDTWNAIDELMVEIKFSDSNSSIKDILLPLNVVLKNIDIYLSLAPKDDVEKAQSLI